MSFSRHSSILAVAGTLVCAPLATAVGQRAIPGELRIAPATEFTHVVKARVPVVRHLGAGDSTLSARRPSYAGYALWGTGIGAVVGFGVGTYSYRYNNSGCDQCFTPDEAIPLIGAVVGAATGLIVGSLAYLLARSTPPGPP